MMSSLDFPSGQRSPPPEAASTVWRKGRRRAAPWRPSLMSISEDVALFAKGDAAAKAAAGGGGGTRKAPRAKSASRVGQRSFKDDYGFSRYCGGAKDVPAFSPAAFIFFLSRLSSTVYINSSYLFGSMEVLDVFGSASSPCQRFLQTAQQTFDLGRSIAWFPSSTHVYLYSCAPDGHSDLAQSSWMLALPATRAKQAFGEQNG